MKAATLAAILSTLLEILGLCAVVAAAALWDPRLGLAVFGAVAVVCGLAIDPPRRAE
jgi:uncharacterized membrane protein